jgi:hypothetical protein
MGNLEHIYNTVLQDIDGQLICCGYPSPLFTAVFIFGDIVLSVGLFLLFCVPMRRLTMQNKATLNLEEVFDLGDLRNLRVLSREICTGYNQPMTST